MENFTFCTPTRYVFGRGAECKAAELCKVAGWKTVMIVYGGSSAIRSGLLDRVKASLTEAGLNTVELGGVRPNPTDDKVYEGIALGREKKIDSLLAVGGGSVIDTAKAIAAGIPYEGDFWDFYCGKTNIREALPLGVVLTIPAAGSEGRAIQSSPVSPTSASSPYAPKPSCVRNSHVSTPNSPLPSRHIRLQAASPTWWSTSPSATSRRARVWR